MTETEFSEVQYLVFGRDWAGGCHLYWHSMRYSLLLLIKIVVNRFYVMRGKYADIYSNESRTLGKRFSSAVDRDGCRAARFILGDWRRCSSMKKEKLEQQKTRQAYWSCNKNAGFTHHFNYQTLFCISFSSTLVIILSTTIINNFLCYLIYKIKTILPAVISLTTHWQRWRQRTICTAQDNCLHFTISMACVVLYRSACNTRCSSYTKHISINYRFHFDFYPVLYRFFLWNWISRYATEMCMVYCSSNQINLTSLHRTFISKHIHIFNRCFFLTYTISHQVT